MVGDEMPAAASIQTSAERMVRIVVFFMALSIYA